MDEQTALLLSLQLIALLSVAGALLSYLLCKIRGNSGPDSNYPGAGKSVLITSCGNTFGLQVNSVVKINTSFTYDLKCYKIIESFVKLGFKFRNLN